MSLYYIGFMQTTFLVECSIPDKVFKVNISYTFSSFSLFPKFICYVRNFTPSSITQENKNTSPKIDARNRFYKVKSLRLSEHGIVGQDNYQHFGIYTKTLKLPWWSMKALRPSTIPTGILSISSNMNKLCAQLETLPLIQSTSSI